ncbi:MAG: hypothetical protein KJO08_04550 [Gammaproteobacteria bacterium]|nr:hypothetical protein [Gammaproteobacteria bacterium]
MELDKLNADLQIELDELRKEVEEKNQKISDFESNMETLFLHHESFYLEDGELKKLFGADHIFSVTHVSYDVIHTIFNNKRILLGLGEYITFQQNGNRCRLLLEKANPNNGGYFSVLCDK